jgi:hypothetical protein
MRWSGDYRLDRAWDAFHNQLPTKPTCDPTAKPYRKHDLRGKSSGLWEIKDFGHGALLNNLEFKIVDFGLFQKRL